MPIIPSVGRRSWYLRFILACVYGLLSILGLTMVVPFMITLSSSIANDFDYERFWPIPRYFWSENDRFVKGAVYYFNSYPEWYVQMRNYFRAVPPQWTSWQIIGKDVRGVDQFARQYLRQSTNSQRNWRQIARDYSVFEDHYPIEDARCPVSDVDASFFLAERYERLWAARNPQIAKKASSRQRRDEALKLLGKAWDIPLPDFFSIGFEKSELRLPVWQQSWLPPTNPKYQDYLCLNQAYRSHYFTPGIRRKWLRYLRNHHWPVGEVSAVFPVSAESPRELQQLWSNFKGDVAPASPAVPFAMRAVWRSFLESEKTRTRMGLKAGESFSVKTYNQLAGTNLKSLEEMPFPVPEDSGKAIKNLWEDFVKTRYPARLSSLLVTPDLTSSYHQFLQKRFKTLANANQMQGTHIKAWEQFELTSCPPEGVSQQSLRSVWVDFVKELPVQKRILTSSEIAYQQFLLQKYRSLTGINKTYGWRLRHLEEAQPPVDLAYALTFKNNETAFALAPLMSNYFVIADYLFRRGRAVTVTLLLVGLAILSTLTINPLAAYALSRFNLRGQSKVLLFMLATMAFPAMVSAIPAYLLMRDLGLLNTFFALVLPGAANGMAIFMLKGFFDSLPQELYEAATIDGAPEWQIFLRITMPMMKPILAIQALGAFLWAYNSWEWALIICQNQKMWTMAVWMYQANEWWNDKPWLVSAGFVVVAIPTFLVFLFCQKIILRGIIIPSMK